MANITKFARVPAGDNIETEGNTVTAGDPWLLHLDTIPSSAVAAYNAIQVQGFGFGFPRRGASHPNLSSLLMVDYTVEHYDGQKSIFMVTVNYTNDREETDENGFDDPLDIPADYDFQQLDRQVVITLDAVTGEPLQNYAGTPYLAVTENKPLTRVVVVRNERNYNNSEAESLRNKTNKRSMRIDGYSYKKGVVKLEVFVGTKRRDQEDNIYYTVRYSLLINDELHTRKIPNRGAKNKKGRPAPGALTAGDGAANLAEDGTFLPKDAAVLIDEWNTLGEADLSVLRL